jgi:hypothetical protein
MEHSFMFNRNPPEEPPDMPTPANATNDPEPVEQEDPPVALSTNPDEDPPEPADIDRESR